MKLKYAQDFLHRILLGWKFIVAVLPTQTSKGNTHLVLNAASTNQVFKPLKNIPFFNFTLTGSLLKFLGLEQGTHSES